MTTPTSHDRRRLARELALGAPVAALVWLLALRLLLGAWSWQFPLAVACFSLVFAALVLAPAPAGPLAWRAWRGLVAAIDWVVTRVLCVMLYYLVFTPVGLVLRLLRVRLLQSGREPGAATYWRNVSPPGDARRHYFRQY